MEIPTTPWHMALLLQERDISKSPEHDKALDLILISLLTDQPIPPILLQQARRRIKKSTDESDSAVFNGFLRFASPQEEVTVRSVSMTSPVPPTSSDEVYPLDTGSLDLVDLDGLTNIQRYAVLKGRAFAEAEILQIGRTPGGPQRTIGQTSLQAASRRPSRADDLIYLHGTVKHRGSRLSHPDRLHRIQAYADEEMTMPPRRFNRSEQAQFLRGYRLQRSERQKEFSWYRERKKLKKTEQDLTASK